MVNYRLDYSLSKTYTAQSRIYLSWLLISSHQYVFHAYIETPIVNEYLYEMEGVLSKEFAKNNIVNYFE